MDQTTVNLPNNNARPLATNNDPRLAQAGNEAANEPIELLVTPHGPADEVVARFNDAMQDGQVSADEREDLQSQIRELDAGERKELYRDIIRDDRNGESAPGRLQAKDDRPDTQLAEFFKVLDQPVEGGFFGPKSALPAGQSAEFADAITQHATVEQRTQFIDAAAPDVTDNANLARAVGQVVISLDGNAEAMYEAMGSLFDADTRNAPLKAVMEASTNEVDVHAGVGAEQIAHDQLNELIRTIGETLQAGREDGELSEQWSRVYSGALFEAGSRVISETVNQPFNGAPVAEINATLGELTHLVVQDGAALVNTLDGSYGSWDGGLETMFNASLQADNTRAPGAIIGALRTPLDQLAGEIQAAHDAGNTERVEALHASLEGNEHLAALKSAGSAMNTAIEDIVGDVSENKDKAQNLWTGTARSAAVIAGAAIGGPAGIAFGVAAYASYAAGGQAIDDHFNGEISTFDSQSDFYEYIATPRNTGKEDDPKLAPNTDVAPGSAAEEALRDLKRQATAELG